jgi:hypothetical protein
LALIAASLPPGAAFHTSFGCSLLAAGGAIEMCKR